LDAPRHELARRNSDATTCDLSLGLRGHRVERGVIGALVKEMNLTGDVLTLRRARRGRQRSVALLEHPRPDLVFEGADLSGS
jgi:hypothetical protein